jgi:hypothetical protein
MAIDPTLIYGGEENYSQKGIRVSGWNKNRESVSIKKE